MSDGMTIGCCVTTKFHDRGMLVAPGDKKGKQGSNGGYSEENVEREGRGRKRE